MDVPKYVIDSIEKSAKAFMQARKHEKIVRDWLEKKEIDNDFILDNWIDTIEMGHGLDDDFIGFLRSL
ncbi:hypothetical protein PDN53_24045 [Bacillus cereus]|nr:hypothetical protein [Bacillus cereus]